MWFAEKKIHTSLRKMANAAQSDALRAAFKNSSALDAALIAGAQAVEHHEIAFYGTLKAWADQLGMKEAASLLDETLSEEKDTDEALTQLAEDIVNPKAKKDHARKDDDEPSRRGHRAPTAA
jgi:ferritin-like metal-binding protein YciE